MSRCARSRSFRIMYLIFHRRLGTASALSTCGGGHTMSPSVVASCSFLLISSNTSLTLGRQPVDHHGFASPSTSVLFRIICSPCTPLPRLPLSGGFTLGASSFVTPWGLITHSRFLPFVRRAHHRHLPSFSRPDLLAAAVELCLALPAAALGLVLLLLRPPLAYVSSARTPSFCAFGPPVPSLSFG